jgi:hypothetical protein
MEQKFFSVLVLALGTAHAVTAASREEEEASTVVVESVEEEVRKAVANYDCVRQTLVAYQGVGVGT